MPLTIALTVYPVALVILAYLLAGFLERRLTPRKSRWSAGGMIALACLGAFLIAQAVQADWFYRGSLPLQMVVGANFTLLFVGSIALAVLIFRAMWRAARAEKAVKGK